MTCHEVTVGPDTGVRFKSFACAYDGPGRAADDTGGERTSELADRLDAEIRRLEHERRHLDHELGVLTELRRDAVV